MAEPETCAGCDTPLTEGIPDVFCPACALRRALALGTALTPIGEQQSNPPQFKLASQTEGRAQSAMMSTVAPSAGDVISDYKLLERIGGNMGIVFKAQHESLGKTVALKLIPAEALVDGNRRKRFQREIRAMGKLSHDNLVSASDARTVGPWHLVAMEWIDGRDLQQILRAEGPLPIDLACEAARQAALALECVHRNELIHRDVKPSNLMLTGNGTIKLIDLGLALPVQDESAQLTRTGHVLGSMPYCAPEQIRDSSNVDPRADIYGLGCTLYHLLSGKAPYSDRHRSFHEIIEAHRTEPFPSILQARGDGPEALDKLLRRMTAKDPNARFSSAAEVAHALEPFARGANLSRLLVPKMPKPINSQVRTLTAAHAKPEVFPTSRNKLWIAAGTAALLLAALALASRFSSTPLAGAPVVVLMDTTAPGGVYDDKTRDTGGTNAEVLEEELEKAIPAKFVPMKIRSDWHRDYHVAKMNAALVVIHRSSFFHTWNAELKLGMPPFTNVVAGGEAEAQARWDSLYRLGDERLGQFLGFVGTVSPQTLFLIYSRGTDTNWLDNYYREQVWVPRLENRFPSLKGRVSTMVIPGEKKGSFTNLETADAMRKRVASLLRLPENRSSE
jgi:serine/threonine protein kinase